jgi:transposase
VDFRKGANGLAALIKDEMKADPFSGVVYIFRAKRAQQARFCIQFAVAKGEARLSLAPAIWPYAAGLALPPREGFLVHLHRGAA